MRIKCKDCMNENNRRCTVKDVTINPGKHRKCERFELDAVRELVRLKRATAIQDRYVARQEAYRNFQAGQKVNTKSNTKYPVTGNLDRFKTA